MLSGMLHKKPYMTRVVVSDCKPPWPETWLGWASDVATKLGVSGGPMGGVEDELDADGGNCIKYLKPPSLPVDSDPQPLSSDVHIPWNARYNYRLGFGATYELSNVVLYKNGTVTESQTYTPTSVGLRHFGFNLDPSNRNETTALVGWADAPYTKYET